VSKKEKIDNINEEVDNKEEVKVEPFKYGIAPTLNINMVRENRLYRFEMPVGAKLVECQEACEECLNVVKKMLEESIAKEAEAVKKAEEAKEEGSFESIEEE